VLLVGLVLVLVSWTISITGLVRSLRSTIRLGEVVWPPGQAVPVLPTSGRASAG
jgi:hypothetical protein